MKKKPVNTTTKDGHPATIEKKEDPKLVITTSFRVTIRDKDNPKTTLAGTSFTKIQDALDWATNWSKDNQTKPQTESIKDLLKF